MATIVTRAGKGEPLTHAEVDANFTNLNADKLESGSTVASLDINGGTIDGTVIGGTTAAAISGTTGAFSGDVTIPDRIIHSGDTNTQIRFPAADTVTIETDGAERMRIDLLGNVLLGTTDTTLFNNTSGTGVCYRAGASFDVLSASDNAIILNRAGTDGGIAEFRKSGTTVGGISVTGSSTAYNTSSDYRLKEDVQPIVSPTDRVLALKPCNFAWKADGSRVDGFLAHEAQAIVPEAVHGAKDEVSADGNPVYQGIDQSKLVPLLTAALQEALQTIQALEARVAALEAPA